MNYFELFALPQEFEVDTSALSIRYHELQRAVHPDNFATGSERERLLAVQKTAEVNDAYQTLKSPLMRAEYILRLHGVELQGETTTIKDPIFLMQQLELREALADLADSADPLGESMALEQQFSALKNELMANLMGQLAQEDWLVAADSIRKLKFIHKLDQELTLLEEQWQ